ncbi:MAG: beta-N-acetylhexosaminidase [Bacteroidetes bacterium]|nr:beta-N-acetylhexosaminidase [Bacteroidota bacterium]
MPKYLLLCLIFLLSTLSCTNEYKHYQNAEADYQIIPQVTALQQLNGRFIVNEKTQVIGDEALESEGTYLGDILSGISGQNINFQAGGKGNIQLLIDSTIVSEEGYVLSVSYDKIKIKAHSPKGIFYGIQSLRQLLETGEEPGKFVSIPAVQIEDSPKYGYRGMHLDVCRHFFPVDFIKRYIDLLAMHKMNTFHWHLTEDQAWRIEIKKYPELTSVGAWRNGTIEGHYPGTGNDNKRYGGFYTREEVKEVVAYAAKKHITVIPEIEMPGHSSAAIAAYPFLSCFPEEPSIVPNDMMSDASRKAQASGQPKIVQESWGVFDDVYCAGKEETFTFLENVLEEVMELFPSTYIHIGGDECPKANWKRCPHCQQRKEDMELEDEHQLQSYFINRIEKFVNSKGRQIIGWDEILEGGLAPNATVMSWRGNKGGIAAAEQSHTVIMAPNSHCYFDHYQSEDKENEPLAIGGFLPLEKVYHFNPTPAALEKDKHAFILGGQANLWTEYIDSEAYAEYMLLPRMTALSEVLWSADSRRDWDDFQTRLNAFRRHYDQLGLNYATHGLGE